MDEPRDWRKWSTSSTRIDLPAFRDYERFFEGGAPCLTRGLGDVTRVDRM